MNDTADIGNIDVHHHIRNYFANENGGDERSCPQDRFASFDYCFNYFQSFRERWRIADIGTADNLQQSCLHIAFYLASWGMLRGSSVLLQRSVKFYCPLIDTITRLDNQLWGIDVDAYTDDNISLLLKAAEEIRKAVGGGKWASDTLVTKIMLGVFGNVPAFDTYFGKGLGVWTLNPASLKRVAEFYGCHRDVIDECAASIQTLDFLTGEYSGRHYTKAKIVDMVGFMAGDRESASPT